MNPPHPIPARDAFSPSIESGESAGPSSTNEVERVVDLGDGDRSIRVIGTGQAGRRSRVKVPILHVRVTDPARPGAEGREVLIPGTALGHLDDMRLSELLGIPGPAPSAPVSE